jgi:hypothetical protein
VVALVQSFGRRMLRSASRDAKQAGSDAVSWSTVVRSSLTAWRLDAHPKGDHQMRPEAAVSNPEIAILMDCVCNEAWRKVLSTTFFPSSDDEDEVRSALAARVMAAITAGERDPERLKLVALGGV